MFPASKTDKIILKNLSVVDDRIFVQYKSTFNDMPFSKTELFLINGDFVICGDDGTILFRLPAQIIEELIEE